MGAPSALYRPAFHALWLPCSRGRCSNVHLRPREPLVRQKGAKSGGVAGSPLSSLVLPLKYPELVLHRPFFDTVFHQVGRLPSSPASGGKEWTLASRFPGCEDSAVLCCGAPFFFASQGQPDSPSETTTGPPQLQCCECAHAFLSSLVVLSF